MRPPCADRALCRAGACPSLGAPRVARRWNDLRGGSGRQAQTRTWAIWIAPCSVGVVSSLFPVSERSVSRTVGNAETQHPSGFAGGCCLCSQVPIHSHSLREHGGLNDVQYSGSRAAAGHLWLGHRHAVHRCHGCVRAAERRRAQFPLQRERRLRMGGGAVKSLPPPKRRPLLATFLARAGFGGGGVCPVRVASASRQVSEPQ